MINLNFANIQTTVREDTTDDNSPIQMQFKWGDNERVRFCKSRKEMDDYEVAHDWWGAKSPKWYHIAYHFNEESFIPYLILSYIELVNWRKPDTVALVKLNKVGMMVYYKGDTQFNAPNFDRICEHAHDMENRYQQSLKYNNWTRKEWLMHNELCGCFGDSYLGD